jgi:hypothetical protein
VLIGLPNYEVQVLSRVLNPQNMLKASYIESFEIQGDLSFSSKFLLQ